MKIKCSVDMSGVVNTLKQTAPKQVKFAVQKTVSALALDGMNAVKAEMPKGTPGGKKNFDRPTPFTMAAPAFEGAKKVDFPVARVFLRESSDTGQSKYGYLNPGTYGTAARHQKRAEMLLMRNGWLPPGYVTVPGKAMPVDPKTGAMAGQYYRWIINVLQLKKIESKQAKGIFGKSVARSKKMGVDVEIFVALKGNRLSKGGAPGGGRLPPGIYKHLPGRKLLQMLKFVPRAAYTPRLDMQGIVGGSVKANASRRWNESVNLALLTAKK